eukprot:TRINITY_DN3415_c0_g1_i1.p1 TRINITY_DN3415_c0_g1~~TRINITY_DN3415_c0_g1_i1.p1  ORF type:complete len:658 (+),score=183.40 TRINITY_DN3415_c0_g1_i1:200-2173(+)
MASTNTDTGLFSKFNSLRSSVGNAFTSKTAAVSSPKDRSSTLVLKKYKQACKSFVPQLWRPSICSECFLKRDEHPSVILEEQLINKDDPTELYEMVEKIGTGSSGTVFIARGVKTKNIYAVKFIPVKSTDDEIVEIINEIEIMKQSFECPFVVEYYGCYMRNEALMIVMEYCCCSLADILRFCVKPKEDLIKERHIAAVCAALVKGLAYLHACDISHRDIKSANVLMKETGEVKLADFGASHQLKDKQDRMKTIAGSAYWCAPEVITADSYDNKVDIWSMGIVLLELAEGKPPFWELEPLEALVEITKAPAPRLKNPEAWSADFVDFLEKCLQVAPNDRATARSLLCHNFVLTGSSSQILIPLVEQCLPVLIPLRNDAIRGGHTTSTPASALRLGEPAPEPVKQGVVISVDKTTKKVGAITEMTDTINKAFSRVSRALSLSTYSSNNQRSSPKEERKPATKPLFFGIPLEESIKYCDSRKENHPIYRIIDHLTLFGLDEEGIFRISGNVKVVTELKALCDSGAQIDFSKYTCFDSAALLKMYFRSLPEPITTNILYRSLVAAMDLPEGERVSTVKVILEGVPTLNLEVLKKLVKFLLHLSTHSSKNMMSVDNIARCFAPNLLFLPEKETTMQTILQDSPKIITLVQLMINRSSEVFP